MLASSLSLYFHPRKVRELVIKDETSFHILLFRDFRVFVFVSRFIFLLFRCKVLNALFFVAFLSGQEVRFFLVTFLLLFLLIFVTFCRGIVYVKEGKSEKERRFLHFVKIFQTKGFEVSLQKQILFCDKYFSVFSSSYKSFAQFL